MATRQYIGARYVPKFDGIHDLNKAYEPLTIVTDSNYAVSYTSKKYVPVGIALTNDEYWAVTGTVSGAILDLQNRMTSAENKIDNDEILIDENRKSINTHSIDNVIAIGDSWGTGREDANGWTYYLPSIANVNKLYMSAIAGSGFLRTGVKTFKTQLEEILIDISNTDITQIIVVGNVNDSDFNAGQITQALKDFTDRALQLYPNCVVKFLNINRFRDYNNYNNVMASAGYNANGYRGRFFYYNMQNVIPRAWFSDGFHSTSIGYEKVARTIAGAIRGVSNSGVDETRSYSTYQDTTKGASFGIYVYRQNVGDVTKLYVCGMANLLYMDSDSPIAVSLSQTFNLTLTEGLPLDLGDDAICEIPVAMIAANANSTQFTTPMLGTLRLKGNTATLKTVGVTGDNTTRIYFRPVNTLIPSNLV